MKLTESHFLNDFFKGNNRIRYNQHEKLCLTKKVIESSLSLKFNSVEKSDEDIIYFDKLYDEINSYFNLLKRRKLLLFFPDNDFLVYEYSFNGVYMEIKTHFWYEGSIITSETNVIGKDLIDGNKLGFVGPKIYGSEYTKMRVLSEVKENFGYETLEDYYLFNFLYILKFVLFIELSKDKVSYKTILPKSKTGHILKGNLFKNESKISITQVDSLWEVESISLGEFKVNGHFRLQRCGVGLSEVKLIYINEFKKSQYIRRRTRDLTFNE